MIRFIFRVFVGLFVASFVIGMLHDLSKPRNPLLQPGPQQAISPEEEAAARDIMTRAYAVGRTLSRGGALKPTADQLDAMSRRMQTQMGDTHSKMWFKQHFESGFWLGWNER